MGQNVEREGRGEEHVGGTHWKDLIAYSFSRRCTSQYRVVSRHEGAKGTAKWSGEGG